MVGPIYEPQVSYPSNTIPSPRLPPLQHASCKLVELQIGFPSRQQSVGQHS